MTRVCVTGAAGFIGSHLVERLVAMGHEVCGIVDNLLGGAVVGLSLPHLTVADCCDLDAMTRALEGVEVVFHLAAAPHEGLSVFSPCIITRNTYLSTVTTATAAIRNGVKRFVFTSSMARYGKGHGRSFSELDHPFPVDPYGVAKVAAEDALVILGKAHGMEVVVCVPHNVYGEKQKYDDPYRNVVAIMMNLMLQGKQPIIYGDGEQQRVFTYVDDCVAPLVTMGFASDMDGQVINVGPDQPPTSMNELVRLLNRAMGTDYAPMYVKDRPCEVKRAWPSTEKARRLLGVTSYVPLEEGLARMLGWMKQKGPKPFSYHLPLEIDSEKAPATWRERLF